MKRKALLLLRHAKSSWKDPLLDDHERPLNSRGRQAAERIGRLMREEEMSPDLVFCSTAQRTRETADLVFAKLAVRPEIVFRDDLYHAAPQQITVVLSQIVEPTRCVLLIGHNPGLEEFLLQITGEELAMPTGALARVDFAITEWSQFSESTRGNLYQLWRPREIDSD